MTWATFIWHLCLLLVFILIVVLNLMGCVVVNMTDKSPEHGLATYCGNSIATPQDINNFAQQALPPHYRVSCKRQGKLEHLGWCCTYRTIGGSR